MITIAIIVQSPPLEKKTKHYSVTMLLWEPHSNFGLAMPSSNHSTLLVELG